MTRIIMSATVIGFVVILVSGTNIIEAKDKDLFQAAGSGDLRMVRFLLEIGTDVNVKDKDGKTALMFTSDLWGGVPVNAYLEVAELLLDKGADVNAEDKDGKTALMVASDRGRLEVLKLLLVKGADVNTKDKDGKTALMVVSNNPEVAKLLLDNGADVNAKDKDGKTALLVVVGRSSHILKLLLDKGADVNARDKDGKTALMMALRIGHFEVAKLLLDKGADINTKDEDGKTVLMSTRDLKVLKLLLDKGADVNAKDKDGKTALMVWSVGMCDIVLVKLFLDKGADVNAKNYNGYTLLMVASSRGELEVAKLLLDRGADVNAKNNNDKTALMMASGNGELMVAKLLLDKGADVNAEDKYRSTALFYASSKSHHDMVNLLKAYQSRSSNTSTGKIIVEVEPKTAIVKNQGDVDVQTLRPTKTPTIPQNTRSSDQTSEDIKLKISVAENGDVEAQLNLGLLYFNGQGVSKDYAEAYKWWQKAAEQGRPEAQFMVGVLFFNGQGVSRDASEAARWWIKAAEQGITHAQSLLGNLYFKGTGVDQNISEAKRWWMKAAEGGNPDAIRNLAILNSKSDIPVQESKVTPGTEKTNSSQQVLDKPRILKTSSDKGNTEIEPKPAIVKSLADVDVQVLRPTEDSAIPQSTRSPDQTSGDIKLKISTADQGDAEAKPVPFPVIFSEDETPGTQDYLVKMIRACTILGTASLRSYSEAKIYQVFKGRPPDLYKVTEAIIGKQPVCNPATKVPELSRKNLAQKIGYLTDEKFMIKMEVLRYDPYDEKNCTADLYFCRDQQKARKKEGDLRKERLTKHELEFLSEISPLSSGASGYHCSPQCTTYIRDLLKLVDTTIDSAFIERTEYLKAIEIQQKKIAAEKSRGEAELKLRQEQEFQNYVRSIKSGQKRIESMNDANIYYDPIDGYQSYVAHPPMKMPHETRYLYLQGFVEDKLDESIICSFRGQGQDRWAFETAKLKSYLPRKGEHVEAIGKIVNLIEGRARVGPVYMIVIDPVAFQAETGSYYAR